MVILKNYYNRFLLLYLNIFSLTHWRFKCKMQIYGQHKHNKCSTIHYLVRGNVSNDTKLAFLFLSSYSINRTFCAGCKILCLIARCGIVSGVLWLCILFCKYGLCARAPKWHRFQVPQHSFWGMPEFGRCVHTSARSLSNRTNANYKDS